MLTLLLVTVILPFQMLRKTKIMATLPHLRIHHLLWTIVCGCNPRLHSRIVQSSPELAAHEQGHVTAMTWAYYFISYGGKGLIYMAAKFIFPWNQVNLEKSSISKAPCQEPRGRWKLAVPWQPSAPCHRPLPRLMVRAELSSTGREMPCSDPHRWTHLSACHVGVS